VQAQTVAARAKMAMCFIMIGLNVFELIMNQI